MTMSKLIVVNTDFIPGYRISEALGLVRGSTVRAKHLGKDIMAGLRSIVGGEVKEYGQMLIETRAESVKRMRAQAEELGADAIINVRFMTSQVMSGASEMMAYGTAVKLERET